MERPGRHPGRIGSTERLARWCSTHPRRTLAGWGLAIVVALAAVILAMGELSSEGHVTGNPESQQAASLIDRAFPPDPRRLVSDIIVVRSARYRVQDRVFHDFIHRYHQQAMRTGRGHKRDQLLQHARPVARLTRRARDDHPALVRNDDQIEPIVRIVDRADADASFTVSMTGEHTLNSDFNKLSQTT